MFGFVCVPALPVKHLGSGGDGKNAKERHIVN
jgi:hypothetical protein